MAKSGGIRSLADGKTKPMPYCKSSVPKLIPISTVKVQIPEAGQDHQTPQGIAEVVWTRVSWEFKALVRLGGGFRSPVVRYDSGNLIPKHFAKYRAYIMFTVGMRQSVN